MTLRDVSPPRGALWVKRNLLRRLPASERSYRVKPLASYLAGCQRQLKIGYSYDSPRINHFGALIGQDQCSQGHESGDISGLTDTNINPLFTSEGFFRVSIVPSENFVTPSRGGFLTIPLTTWLNERIHFLTGSVNIPYLVFYS